MNHKTLKDFAVQSYSDDDEEDGEESKGGGGRLTAAESAIQGSSSLDQFLTNIFGHQSAAGNEPHGPSITWVDTEWGKLPDPDSLRQIFQTKSAAIRYLHDKGVPVKRIALLVGIRYQHARNVLHNQLKRGPNEDWRFNEDEDKRISKGLEKF